MSGYSIPAYANGNLVPRSFVIGASGYPGRFTQATANALVAGAVGEKLKYPQGLGGSATLAAEAGDEFQLIMPGSLADITLGGTVTETAYVKSDASGYAVAAALTGTTLQNVAGMAYWGGASGEIGKVFLTFFKFIPALS